MWDGTEAGQVYAGETGSGHTPCPKAIIPTCPSWSLWPLLLGTSGVLLSCVHSKVCWDWCLLGLAAAFLTSGNTEKPANCCNGHAGTSSWCRSAIRTAKLPAAHGEPWLSRLCVPWDPALAEWALEAVQGSTGKSSPKTARAVTATPLCCEAGQTAAGQNLRMWQLFSTSLVCFGV